MCIFIAIFSQTIYYVKTPDILKSVHNTWITQDNVVN